MCPSPQGTTTLVLPKQTVTFIFLLPSLPPDTALQEKLLEKLTSGSFLPSAVRLPEGERSFGVRLLLLGHQCQAGARPEGGRLTLRQPSRQNRAAIPEDRAKGSHAAGREGEGADSATHACSLLVGCLPGAPTTACGHLFGVSPERGQAAALTLFSTLMLRKKGGLSPLQGFAGYCLYCLVPPATHTLPGNPIKEPFRCKIN